MASSYERFAPRLAAFSAPESREADLFFEDLTGGPAEQRLESLEGDSGLESDGGWTAEGPEPFFGDASDHYWKVVARPGARIHRRLRRDDLVVDRAEGGRVWRCMLVADADPNTIYQRGTRRVLRDDVIVLRRERRRRWWDRQTETDGEEYGELTEVCGFFGPNDVRRTEREIRDAIVARANTEWSAWHNAAGAPRRENDVGMFGQLVGYYLATNSAILPDTLTAMQASAAGGTINYAPLLTASGATAIAAEVTRTRGFLTTRAPGATATGVAGRVDEAIRQARQAHNDTGPYAAWSAAFVTTCVRGAAIAQGLETVTGSDRRHVGRDELLLAATKHAAYTVRARQRRAATTPRQRGTYHAFRSHERAPQLGDIIVQDRRERLTASTVMTLANLTDLITHGDIVIEVQPDFVVTIGGNLGGSVRKRRYPRNAQGLLATEPRRLYTQETDAGRLPALAQPSAQPATQPSTQALAALSTARIFALLTPVEDCVAVPGQPYKGGTLS
jgi:hypothetical protein